MEFTFVCSHCHRPLVADDTAVGGTVNCPACSRSLVVPPQQKAKPIEQDDIVEILDEFRPARGPVPPLGRRPTTDAPPVLDEISTEPKSVRFRNKPGVPVFSSPEQLRRHAYKPIRRQAQLIFFAVVTLVCGALATAIYFIGQPPGTKPSGYVPSPNQHAAPAAVNQKASLDLSKLSAEEKNELYALTLEAFKTLPPDEGTIATQLFNMFNQQQQMSKEQAALFNKLFGQAFPNLPPDRQQRMQQLFAKTFQNQRSP